MNTQVAPVDRLPFLCVLALVAMALTSCDSSGPGPSPSTERIGANTVPVPFSAVTRGPIQSAEGADIKVNDTVWSAASAKITIDGAAGQVLDLGRGMIVTVQGQRTSQLALANTIDTVTTVRGPFRGFDPVTGHLDVMGQAVFGDEGTVLDIFGGPLDSLYVGQVVTISGFLTARGDVLATRISAAVPAGGLPWIVSGVITAADPSRARFEINDLTVSYAETLLAGLPRAAIDVGQSVVVSGSVIDGNGALVAEKHSPYTEDLRTAANGVAAVSGIVQRVQREGSFLVGTQPAVLSPGVAVPGGFVEGSYVRAVGALRDGVLHAGDFVVLGNGRHYMLDGFIEAIDFGARTFRLLGIQFFVNDWTNHPNESFSGRVVGERISVWAYSNGFVRSIHRPWAGHAPYGVEGEWFSSVAEPSGFTIRSVIDFPVRVTATTAFHALNRAGDGDCYGGGLLSPAEFWERAAAPPPPPPSVTTIYTWGQLDGGVLIAEEVMLCH